MKRWIAPLVALGMLLPATGAGARQGRQSRDERAIADLMDRYAAVTRNRDLDGLMAIYAPGDTLFIFDSNTPRQFVGADIIRQRARDEFFTAVKGPIDFTIEDLAITADSRIGFSHAVAHLKATTNSGEQADITYRATYAYVKTNGVWHIVMEHDSYPIDRATGKPDYSSKL